jgi:hypothetical protein
MKQSRPSTPDRAVLPNLVAAAPLITGDTMAGGRLSGNAPSPATQEP